MKSQLTSVAFSAGLALAVTGCATGAGGSSGQGPDTQAVGQQQRHLASATFALESAYDVQYVKGQVDGDALQPLIYDVLEAMPDQARPDAQKHIYDVISSGQKDAKDLTPEQRAQVASPMSADKLGPQQVEQIGAWGWGGLGGLGLGWGGAGLGFGGLGGFGWGGLGAFGFPAFGGFGWGW
jgi:hypothetical protein